MKIIDGITIAAMVLSPLISGADEIMDVFTGRPQIRIESTSHQKNVDKTSDELLEDLIAENYQPAIDFYVKTTRREMIGPEQEENRNREGIETSFDDISPEYHALLDVIAQCEGADYNIIYGGEKFTDFTTHPNVLVEKWGIKSTAAGRYQFLHSTYTGLKRKGFFTTGFNKHEQNQAALHLIQRKRVNKALLDSAIKNNNFTKIKERLQGTWTSLKGKNESTIRNRFFDHYN